MDKINAYINDKLVTLEMELEETGVQEEIDFIQGEISSLMELQLWLAHNGKE